MDRNATPANRVYSIDLWRGIIMVIMALDHVRDFFHYTAAVDSPTNLMTTTPALFFTRWITHLCAPAFLFLSGVSAYLAGQKRTKKELRKFLITRGFWLVLVELFIVTLGWTFDPLFQIFILQVIWAIGISMIILGLMVNLPTSYILTAGLLIICFHNLLDPAEAAQKGDVGLVWNLVHHANFSVVPLFGHHVMVIVYAFLPWTGIMLLGFGMGKLFTAATPAARRRKILYRAGISGIAIFLVLRMINHYGDPQFWTIQRNPFYTFLSIINVSKYPPSLDYIAVTVGISLIFLAATDRISKNSLPFFQVFGRVPFFYYVVHLYLIHTITVILFFIQGYGSKDIDAQRLPFKFRPDHFGVGLAGVYLLWIGVLILLYPLCRWYDQYKRTHAYRWLSYC